MLDLISGDRPATLPITQIRRDGGTQPRQGMDEDAVNDYANALRNGERLPAVDVMFDGSLYWLFDGFHRTEAHLRAGLDEIAVTIHQGGLEDAQWRSFGANKGHGLRRSNADKERAVRAALRHATGAGLSNVQIARHVGVDDKTVARYRAEMESTSEIPRLETRTGADGKERKAPNPYAPRRVATFKADLTDPNSADVHVMQFAHVLPLRPLTADETEALIWRVARQATGSDDSEWRNRAPLFTWLTEHAEIKHYHGAVDTGTHLDELTFAEAFHRVRRNFESKGSNQPSPSPGPAAPAAGPAVVPPSPPVTPTMPADLEGAGWALLRVGGVGNWYCLNRTLSKATATHEDASEAIAEAYVMQGTPWRDLVTPVAGGGVDETVTLTVTLTRTGLVTLRNALAKRSFDYMADATTQALLVAVEGVMGR